MFDTLISKLLDFAFDNNLVVDIVATKNDLTYTVQDKKLAWGYSRSISRMQYEMYSGDRMELIRYEIERLRKYLFENRLI